METATQQDIDRLRDDLGKTWADFRDRLERHEKLDDEREIRMSDEVKGTVAQINQWSGAVRISAWLLALILPTILGLLIADIAKHG